MERQEAIVILRTCQPFFSVLTAYGSSKFHTNDHRINIRSILLAIGIGIFLFVYVFLFVPMELSACIEQRFNLNVIAQPLSFFLGAIQVFFVIGSFLWKRDKLIETVDYLQGIVKMRKNL